MSSLTLKNPHSILAALSTRPRDVLQLALPPSGKGETDSDTIWAKIAQVAKQNGIQSRSGNVSAPSGNPGKQGRRGDARAQDKTDGRVSFAEAVVRERDPISTEELFRGAREKSGGKGLWLALDCLQDPHNVGAIFRAAAFFGVNGILMTQERSAPITATVYDVATGGLEYVPFAVHANLQRAFEIAKDEGLWILGTSEHAKDSLAKVERDRPWLLVLGNEEKGMRRLTQESCDMLCTIPSKGNVTSLNVSVASGILISTLTGALSK